MPSSVPAPYLFNPSAAAPPSAKPATAAGGFSFHDLLDIVNPLQHLPVIGTLYRAITGDRPGTFEKLAGDTLYGGVWGAVASVADIAFEAVTGKDFGDTVMALLEPSHKDAALTLAQNTVSPAAQNAVPGPASSPDVAAFAASLQGKGIDGALASRALFAYRRSMGLTDMALESATP
jgi:hypothetical protein